MQKLSKLAPGSYCGSRPTSRWALITPFGAVTSSEAMGYRHGVILGRTRLAEFRARGRVSNPAPYYIKDGCLFTFQGRFDHNSPVYYPWRGVRRSAPLPLP